ncbi:MAG TPA: adenylosuccinate synthetase, partial [Candidatus Sumerlaeota bacterium]|nr:adenylosuccinate synthetase [Candidatus Sumerlaeota bacterium]
CTGLGISPRHINNILGIVKAYTTRVGEGPMLTEQKNEVGERIRKEGGEFGATTGRARRCGWFDAPAVRRAIQVSGCTGIVITKLDVLSILSEIPICVGYETPSGRTNLLPFDVSDIDQCKPIYETMKGWECDLSHVREAGKLPQPAIDYVLRLQELMGVPIDMVSVGPDRRQTLAFGK